MVDVMMSAPSTPRSSPATIIHPSPVRIAVCGATGTVGVLSVHALLASGVNIQLRAGCEAAMINSEAVLGYAGQSREGAGGGGGSAAGGKQEEDEGGVELVELDYLNEEKLERVMSGMDRVFVILPWKRDLPAMMSSVIRTAKRCKTGFILKMSSICANMNSQHKPQIMRDVNTH
jgi:uncharacterized protein YbjT (DUF2867 family)